MAKEKFDLVVIKDDFEGHGSTLMLLAKGWWEPEEFSDFCREHDDGFEVQPEHVHYGTFRSIPLWEHGEYQGQYYEQYPPGRGAFIATYTEDFVDIWERESRMNFQHTAQLMRTGRKTQTRRVKKPGEQLVIQHGLKTVLTATGRIKWQVDRDYSIQEGRNAPGIGRTPPLSDIREEFVQHIDEMDAAEECGWIKEPVAFNWVDQFSHLWEQVHGLYAWNTETEVWALDFAPYETVTCWRCGWPVIVERSFGDDIIQTANHSEPYIDLVGHTIRSHRFGNCPHCWAMLELINGVMARSMLIPVGATHE